MLLDRHPRRVCDSNYFSSALQSSTKSKPSSQSSPQSPSLFMFCQTDWQTPISCISWLDSIAVSVFVVILVDFDKYWDWDEQACLQLIKNNLVKDWWSFFTRATSHWSIIDQNQEKLVNHCSHCEDDHHNQGQPVDQNLINDRSIKSSKQLADLVRLLAVWFICLNVWIHGDVEICMEIYGSLVHLHQAADVCMEIYGQWTVVPVSV